MRRAKIRLSTDSSSSASSRIEERVSDISREITEDPAPLEDENRSGSADLVTSIQSPSPSTTRAVPGRRSRYSMNYQSYEATRIQPAEQTRRMLDYMFPGYQKRDPRNWWEKATQTNLNADEVNSLIGIELIEVEPIETEEDNTTSFERVGFDEEEEDDHLSSVKMHRYTVKPHRSSVVSKGWDGPPINVTGKASEEGFFIQIHDLQHDPQTIMVPKEVFDQRTVRLDVVPDERGIPKVIVYVGDKDERPSEATDYSGTPPRTSTVVLYDNKEEFASRSISTTTVSSPVQTEEEVEVPPPERKPMFILEPVPIPQEEPSNEDVRVEEIPARDSVGSLSAERVEIEYDLEDEPPADDSESTPIVVSLDIVNSRLLEPVPSQGDKEDVDVDLVPSTPIEEPEKSDSDEKLSKEVSDWLADEIYAKTIPRKPESPRNKSETPLKVPTPEPSPVRFLELKVPTPETSTVQSPGPSSPVQSPEPSPVQSPEPTPDQSPEPTPFQSPEPDRNISKEVSDWLNDNVLENAKQEAADRKMSREISNWLQRNILPNAKQAADLSQKPKPSPPELKVFEPEPEPVSEPPSTAGSHAGSRKDSLFSPLENYPNNMDEERSKNIPNVPQMTPSVVSEEDEPLKTLDDFPPKYESPKSSREASHLTSSPPPESAVTPKAAEQTEKSPSRAGSHGSSFGDRLFSQLEDHPSNLPGSSPATQPKTPSPEPMVMPSSDQVIQPKPIIKPPSVTINADKKPDPTHDLQGYNPTIKSDTQGRLPQPRVKLKSVSLSPGDSEPSPFGSPVKKYDQAGPTESDVSGWLNDEILLPVAAENWVADKIVKKALANDENKNSGVPISMDTEHKAESFEPSPSPDQKVPDLIEKEVENWMENEVLIPAQADNWVDKQILKPADKLIGSHSRKQVTPSSRAQLSSPVQPVKQQRETPTSLEIENWISTEVLEPATATALVEPKKPQSLKPVEVSLMPTEESPTDEHQSFKFVNIQALEPTSTLITKSPAQKGHKSLSFDAPLIPEDAKEEKGSLVGIAPLSVLLKSKVEKTLDKKRVDDDSLSWVDSSHNMSPFQPHPDHPGERHLSPSPEVRTRFPQFPDQKQISMPSLTQGPPSHSSTSESPYPNPPKVHGPVATATDTRPFYPAPPMFGIPSQGPSLSPIYGLQTGITTQPLPTPFPGSDQQTQFLPYIPTPLQGHSPLEPSSIKTVSAKPGATKAQPSPTSEPSSVNVVSSKDGPFLSPQETSLLLPSVSQVPPSQELSQGTRASISSGGAKPVESEKKKRESISKDAAEHKEAVPTHHKPRLSRLSKSETRTSLIEKRAIQQDNYLTRDDDNDYEPDSSKQINTKPSEPPHVKRKRSDSFLTDSQSTIHHRHSSPSIFGRFCSPLSRIINKHKSPTRTKRKSTRSSNRYSASDDDNIPPIPTNEASETANKPEMKALDSTALAKKKIISDLGKKTMSALQPPKPDRPETIEEEADEEKSKTQLPNTIVAGQPARTEVLPMYGQPEKSAPPPMPTPHGIPSAAYGQPGTQSLPSSTYEPTHQGIRGTEYRQPGTPSQTHGQPMPMYGFPPIAYGDPSQLRQPSPIPNETTSVGAPIPLEAKYPEDIQASILPKFRDYEEAARRGIRPGKTSESQKIPNPPKRGFPAFPDYKDLTKPRDKLSTLDHAWYDNEEQPAPSPFESSDLFPGDGMNSLPKRVTAEAYEEPRAQVPISVDTNRSPLPSQEVNDDRKKLKIMEQMSSGKNEESKPMAPGSGIPMFPDYYELPVGDLPIFPDSPKLVQKDKRQHPGMSQPQDASGSNYAQLPKNILPYSAQPLQSAAAPVTPLSPLITRYSYSHPDRPLSDLMHPIPKGPPQGRPPRSHQQGLNVNPEMKETRDGKAQSQDSRHASHFPTSSDLSKLPTYSYIPHGELNAPQTQPANHQGQPLPSTQKPGLHGPGQPTTVSPAHNTPQQKTPWEIPSSMPHGPTGHQIPSMGIPADYDQRQMFDPHGLPKQAYSASPRQTPTEHQIPNIGRPPLQMVPQPQQPWEIPTSKPYSTGNEFPSMGRPGEYNPQRALYPQAPGTSSQQSNSALPPIAPTNPTFTKHYYSQPDRPISDLLQHQPKNQQDSSTMGNLNARPGESKTKNSPFPPGSSIPKFGDYDQLVLPSQPHISGDHEPSGKPKIVTAAEKKAQIERELQPINQQMEDLKRQMYLLTSQKGPPIRTGPHSAYSQMPTSLEIYNELEKRTMNATKKEREEFYAERRKKIYEENARMKIRRAIERLELSKTKPARDWIPKYRRSASSMSMRLGHQPHMGPHVWIGIGFKGLQML